MDIDELLSLLNVNKDVDVIQFLESEGYELLFETKNYGLIGVNRFAFTWGILIGLTYEGYNRRYCYPSREECMIGYAILKAQDTLDTPLIDPADPYWIKRKAWGHKDLHNPNNPNLYKL
jgi:hypothetical protein